MNRENYLIREILRGKTLSEALLVSQTAKEFYSKLTSLIYKAGSKFLVNFDENDLSEGISVCTLENQKTGDYIQMDIDLLVGTVKFEVYTKSGRLLSSSADINLDIQTLFKYLTKYMKDIQNRI